MGVQSKYRLNPCINPVGNVKRGNPTNSLEGAQKEGKTERQACPDGRSTELKSKQASSQPRDSDPHLQDGESEKNGILELGKTQVISLGFPPVQELCFLQPSPTPLRQSTASPDSQVGKFFLIYPKISHCSRFCSLEPHIMRLLPLSQV